MIRPMDILDIATNHAVDPDAIEQSLKYATVRNFRTLYDIQKTSCGVHRYDFPIQAMGKVDKLRTETSTIYYPQRYGYTLPESYVFVKSWKKCKSKNLYGIPLSQETISENDDIFSSNFLMFIDGRMITTGEMVVKDSECIVILDINSGEDTNNTDGIPLEVFNQYYENNEMVTVFVVPNYKTFEASFNLLTFDRVYARDIPYKKFGVDTFNSAHDVVFMNTDTDTSMMYNIPVVFDNENSVVSMSMTLPITSSKLKVIIIHMPTFLYDQKEITSENEEWFRLEENYNTPLPVDNMLAMTLDNEVYKFNREISLDLYYPNIYHTNHRNERNAILYLFYKYTSDSKYDNELQILSRLSGDSLDRYRDGTISDIAKDYEPSNNKWLVSEDYVNSIYYPSRPLYNYNALAEMVMTDRNILMKYLYYKLRNCPRFYIYAEKLDLPSRIRNDSYTECKDTGELMEFSSPHYIISLRNSFLGGYDSDFRLFIDTLFVHPNEYTLIKTMDFYHFYIPVERIKEDSVLEIERYVEYDFYEEKVFTSTEDEFVVNLPSSRPFIFTHDIVVINMETMRYLDPYQYTITAYSDLFEKDIDVTPERYAMIRFKFTMKLTDPSLLNKTIRIHVYHRAVSGLLTNEDGITTGIPISHHTTNFNHITKREIRLFHNGLLIPPHCYSLFDTEYYLGRTDLEMYFRADVDLAPWHNLSIDYMPTDYVQEFHLDYIENDYGYVDTKNCLTLPLDLKWYDIYLNGMKLNKKNVDIITSSKFIIQNVESRRNLFIFRRSDFYNEFVFSHPDTIENKLIDNYEQLYNDLFIDKDVIGDTLHDLTEDFIENIANHVDFVKEFLEFIFINPNKQQVTDEIAEAFPEFLNEYQIFTLDTNKHPDAEVITSINSNIRSDFMKNGQFRYAWTPLHLGNHEDAMPEEYLCDPTTGSPGMKNEDGSIVPIGILERLNLHKKYMRESLVNNNIGYLDIYYVEPTENTLAKNVTDGTNLIDEVLTIEKVMSCIVFSIDMDVLVKGMNDVMNHSNYAPRIKITYSVDDSTEETVVIIPAKTAKKHILEVNAKTKVDVKSIILMPENDGDNMSVYKMILHSVLVAC